MKIIQFVSAIKISYLTVFKQVSFQLTFALLLFKVHCSSESSPSDPYRIALKTYLGDKIKEHEELKDIYRKLNPRGYVDWDGLDFFKRFYDPASSSSD